MQAVQRAETQVRGRSRVLLQAAELWPRSAPTQTSDAATSQGSFPRDHAPLARNEPRERSVAITKGSGLKVVTLNANSYAKGKAEAMKGGAVTTAKDGMYTVVTR